MRKFCSVIGCTVIVERGRCAEHEVPVRQHERRHFTGVPGVNYGRRWQREAKRFLSDHVWCRLCPPGSTVLAAEVDHIVPHEGDVGLFWDENNWQALCRECHSRKTMAESRAKRRSAAL